MWVKGKALKVVFISVSLFSPLPRNTPWFVFLKNLNEMTTIKDLKDDWMTIPSCLCWSHQFVKWIPETDGRFLQTQPRKVTPVITVLGMRVMEKMYPYDSHPALLHSDWLGNYLIFLPPGVEERWEREWERNRKSHAIMWNGQQNLHSFELWATLTL